MPHSSCLWPWLVQSMAIFTICLIKQSLLLAENRLESLVILLATIYVSLGQPRFLRIESEPVEAVNSKSTLSLLNI